MAAWKQLIPNESKDIRDWDDDAILKHLRTLNRQIFDLDSYRYEDRVRLAKEIEKILRKLDGERCMAARNIA